MSMKEFVPQGFVPLSDWDFRQRDKSAGHSPAWKLLSDAVKAGEIPGMQFGGSNRWFVHRESAEQFLASQGDEPVQPRKGVASKQAEPAAVDSFCAAVIAAFERRVASSLERIAVAIESIERRQDAAANDGFSINDITTYHEGRST
jgi:hypothetical protein